MGKYTAWDDPQIDQVVQEHMYEIVTAVRSHVEPMAIFLRGSFSQGEGGVVIEKEGLHFLSDYELGVISPHYQHRRWLRAVAQQMTDKLGVETSISRVHPDNIVRNSLGSIPFKGKGIAKPSIAMYEVQNGGLTLYGEPMLNLGPAIDPRDLDVWVGVRLLFNRMAESLDYLSRTKRDWDVLHWINKTILACAEALLIVHKEYHYSYEERGRRFSQLISQLESILVQSPELPDLVQRAVSFKLRPSLEIYPDSLSGIWQHVRQACDVTFRYVIEKYLNISFDNYAEFPDLYLHQLHVQNKLGKNRFRFIPGPLYHNLFQTLKALRDRHRPPVGLILHPMQPAYHITLALVPLMFIDGSESVFPVVRSWLNVLGKQEPPFSDHRAEVEHLRRCTKQAWKDFCYGL